MNSSFSEATARPFEYPIAGMTPSPQPLPWSCDVPPDGDNLEVLLANARMEGRLQGEAEARTRFEEELKQIRCAVGTTIHEFAEQRAQHLRALEGEAVKLALAIVRRVIHRESQVDPDLLLGLVRSALSELEHTSGIRLYAHPRYVDVWKNHFQASHQREYLPEVIADPKMRDHECRIESSMGTTTLSLESSLGEIETGLFDLLASVAPPRKRSNSPSLQ